MTELLDSFIINGYLVREFLTDGTLMFTVKALGHFDIHASRDNPEWTKVKRAPVIGESVSVMD